MNNSLTIESAGVWNRFKKRRVAFWSLCAMLVTFLIVFTSSIWLNFKATSIGEMQFQPPSSMHLFGTDVHGRDVLSRVVQGTQMSILVGLAGALVSFGIGVTWGAFAGYMGGRIDAVMMRFVDILYSLPSIIFVVVLLTTMESALNDFIRGKFLGLDDSTFRIAMLLLSLGSVSWLTMARIVRGQVLSLRSRPFVLASILTGASHFHVIRKHIIPNVLSVAIVYLTLTVPAVVLYESFLSFLGLGVQAPQASLGSLLAEGATQMNSVRTYWWLIVFPGVLLGGLLMGLSFVGDGLRDALEGRD